MAVTKAAGPFSNDNSSPTGWKLLQTIVWLAGLVIFFCLVFYPAIGLLIFWDILIPVAHALLVVGTGVWRNICPLGTTNLLPRHLHLSRQKKMPALLQSKLQLVAVIGLYTIVPLRHPVFNNSGIATALLLLVCIIIGIAMGMVYDWKSGWCSSLCPVHPVEKLYGGNTMATVPNAHCAACINCSVPCPDSTPGFHPAIVTKNRWQQLAVLLTIGGLPGFIWGWFHVADTTAGINRYMLLQSYAMPLAGLACTRCIYCLLQKWLPAKQQRLVVSCFAAAGVSCYYWYRIPALFGFGRFAGDGLLVDLKNILPYWSILLVVFSTSLFFFYWLLIRNTHRKSWMSRPAYLHK